MIKKTTSALCAILVCAGLIPCGNSTTISEPNQQKSNQVLRVITEETVSDGMNLIAKHLANQFMTDNPDVTIQIDILPVDQDERTAYLEELEKDSKNGTGPDLYLLPTLDTLTTEEPKVYSYHRVKPVFLDVQLAMAQGKFQDISMLYDADKELEKNLLNPYIMESGVVDGARYVIPLRYNMPVLYCDKDAVSGIDPEIFKSSFDQWMDYVLSSGSPELAYGAEYPSTNIFPELVDYSTGEVTLTSDLVDAYLTYFQQIEALVGAGTRHRSATSIEGYILGTETNFPVKVGKLNQALDYIAVAAAEGRNIEIYPIRTFSGDTIANVLYYAAIDANSQNTELAYAFLRLFLSEDAQWDTIRNTNLENSSYGLLEQGWPVRSIGSVSPLWMRYKERITALFSGITETTGSVEAERYQIISELSLNEGNLPILSVEPYRIRYSNPGIHEFNALVYGLNDPKTGEMGSYKHMAQSEAFVASLKDMYADEK